MNAINIETTPDKYLISVDRNLLNKDFVLSIPNWSVTPFAKDKDAEKITTEINAYNNVCKDEAIKHKTHFIDITERSLKVIKDSSLLTQDGLHYSEKEMSSWAEMLVEIIEKEIN